MQGCIDILGTMVPVFCAINPLAGRERELEIKKAAKSKKVMVIGGGPGGMEAARVAALRGHEVSLYEKEKELGGQLRWASKALFKSEFEQVIRYFSNQLKKAGVKVNLEQEVDKDFVYKIKPDVVVVATGARPYKPVTHGAEKKHVVSYLDILGGNVTPGKKVAVVGGKLIGCEVAEYISQKGGEVVLLEATGAFCQDSGMKVRWLLMERVEGDSKIERRLKTNVEEIKDTSVVVQKEGKREEIGGVDMVVVAQGAIANNDLADKLSFDSTIPEIYTVGIV
jgi:pyruvate/2-oxoglutarate dehydrogenase complex dihydrolipoamide dehydrogenase (E3) component